MPIVVAQPMKRLYVYSDFGGYVGRRKFLLRIDKIVSQYEHRCVEGTAIRCYISRIFNEKFNLVSRPRIFCSLNFVYAETGGVKDAAEGVYLGITDLANKLSIPDGYIVEILAMAFVRGKEEISIFPFETRIDAVKEIHQQVEGELKALKEISNVFEASSFLKNVGLDDIAKELSDGHARFEQGDYDGSIKAYRKVVEGFRNFLREKTEEEKEEKIFKRLIDGSANRTENIVGFLSKTYSLLSNFGEHYGTKAFDEEGIFARKLVESISEYLAKKLRKT